MAEMGTTNSKAAAKGPARVPPVDLASLKFLQEEISWDQYLKEHKKSQSKAHLFQVWSKVM